VDLCSLAKVALGSAFPQYSSWVNGLKWAISKRPVGEEFWANDKKTGGKYKVSYTSYHTSCGRLYHAEVKEAVSQKGNT
ncbi:hypothetical protein, partial [Streptococcus pneumoniae]|uniref:hypothetical protein n=1 Tax=Streptococcus pneumoniae TaxID=1313 RepID=UPI0018B0D249